jgi:SAM-dependent methyltransferase
MKLFDLVTYKNLLDTLSSQPAAVEFLKETLSMTNVVQASGVQIAGTVDRLIRAQEQVSQAVDQFEQQFSQLKQLVQQLIEQQEPEYFQNSLELYNTGYRNDTAEHIRNRRIVVKPETAEIIQQRLCLYTNWCHPGMVIRPAHALFVEDLVACDPMYFVDTQDSLLELTNSWFTPQYQARLRRYVVDEYNGQPLFAHLPVCQFGLIYAFHFFEYHAWPALQKYLDECFDLLRPGGVLAFTYNNCDLARRVGMVDHYSGCYTPGRLVRSYALELGYEIVFNFDDDTNTSWMELRRPGLYASIRGGQTLAAILPRSND